MNRVIIAFVTGLLIAGGIVYVGFPRQVVVEKPATQEIAAQEAKEQAPSEPTPNPEPVASSEPAPVPPAPVKEDPVIRSEAVASKPSALPKSRPEPKPGKPVTTAKSSKPSTSGRIVDDPADGPPPPLTTPILDVKPPAPSSTTASTAKAEPVAQAAPAPVSPAPTPVVREERPAPPPPPPAPNSVTLKAGTLLNVRLDSAVSTKTAMGGDQFTATLTDPLVVDGFVIAERGSRVDGRVVSADPGGRVKGRATVTVELFRLKTSDGQLVKISTEPFTAEANSSAKSDAAKVGIGAALGAAIGAIAGGGKGAAIGAASGAGAGGAVVLGTRGNAAEIKAETKVTFRIANPVTITEKTR